MTDKELNELLSVLENAGYDAEVVHDAIQQLEAENNCDITEYDNFVAAVEIVHLIDMWRTFEDPVDTLKQIKYAFELIINVCKAGDITAIKDIANQEIKAIDADLKENNKDHE